MCIRDSPHTSTTDHHTTDLPPPSPPQVIERSGNSKTATHLKKTHPGPNIITDTKTRQTGPSRNNQRLGTQPGEEGAHSSDSGKRHLHSSRQHGQSQSTDVSKPSPLTSKHHQQMGSRKEKTEQVQLLSTESRGD